ncbi:uncharacterized protein LOC129329037 [Eublepharis macularius]|uniref:Uncharacterized protein LOC129329037 n=1 Tax=Eublepharis macularius TaxID=481883 RepID=A0AA97KZ50_EUBMA|nr:uncharacterized protein LOC129329037 [Eublepharis macularius]
MAFSFCCCFPCATESSSEREPLNAKHTRQHYEHTRQDLNSKGEAVSFKWVNVSEIDTRFADIAKTFNKKQEDYWAIQAAIQGLKQSHSCSPASSLSVCIEKIQQENNDCGVQVHMEGYRFWLTAKKTEVPEKLEQAVRQVGELNRATIGVISTEIQLQEMICSVLRRQDTMMEKAREANPEYLDWIRIQGNLRENIEKISLVKQHSKKYVDEANNVLREMSKSANLTL